MIIREVAKPTFKDLIGLTSCRFKTWKKDFICEELNEVKIVGSGKAGIALVLQYLKNEKIIDNKLDEVMVPDWIGYWVYNQIQPFAFPAKRFSDKTKVIIVYHQYGWPQDMDKILRFAKEKNLIVIEDCAHALSSCYNGKKIGTFGDFTIFSYSKWFFCFALGGIKSKHPDFDVYVNKNNKNVPFGITFIKDSAKFLYEKSSFSTNEIFKKYANLILGMSYSLYGHATKPGRLAQYLLTKKIAKEIILRQERYQYFRNKINGFDLGDHFKEKDITPYVIPIIAGKKKNKELVDALTKTEVVTGVYNFDVNRNLLAPKFEECVWLPCHSGLSDEKFYMLVDLIVRVVKN